MAFWTHQKLESVATAARGQRQAAAATATDAGPVPFNWIEPARPAEEAGSEEYQSFRELLHRRTQPQTETKVAPASSNLATINFAEMEDPPESDADPAARRASQLPPRRSNEESSVGEAAEASPFAVVSPFSVVTPFRTEGSPAVTNPPLPLPLAPSGYGSSLGYGGSLQVPLASVLASVSAEQLGFSPSSIPLDVEVALDRAQVQAQAARGRVSFHGHEIKERVSPAWRDALLNLPDGQELELPLSLLITRLAATAAPVANSPVASASAVSPVGHPSPFTALSPFGEVELEDVEAPAAGGSAGFAQAAASEVQPEFAQAESAPISALGAGYVRPSFQAQLTPSTATAPGHAEVDPTAAPVSGSPRQVTNDSAGSALQLLLRTSSISAEERRQLGVRVVFGVKRTLNAQDLLNLAESVDGVQSAVLPALGLRSASAAADLAEVALRIREHLQLLQREIGNQSQQTEFLSIDTRRGTICYLEFDGQCLIVQLRGDELSIGSRERLFLLADALVQQNRA